ncbi:M28 family peptidase [Bizionia argentinensis JUB59]|uniref:M28 family peptidase n=1 Tax=Bizionia argentinensis JUB59 TaxID=1046627 RepID=G2ECJ1_9FLAO|nr:M28 family peptidase [Bizionia argentinensis]EGV43878.1 M28 family peptidase [Bizionia argentinensis JUB59]
MRKSVILLSAVLLAFSCGSTQEKQSETKPQQAVNPMDYGNTITSAELKEMLYTFASDEFEGRLTGAKGQKMAVEYLKQQYVAMDVAAAKADGNYFQDVPLEINEAPKVNLTVNGKSFKMIDDFVSASTSKNGSLSVNDIIFADYGIEDEKYNSYTDLDVKGKIVLIKSGEPKMANGNYVISGTDQSSSWSNFRQEFGAKRDAAKDRGAKAVLFYYPEIYEMASKRFGGSNGSMSLRGDAEDMFYFLINTDLAKAIMPTIETATKSKTVSVPMNLEYVNAANEFSSENVAAFIKGSEYPDEIIVLSAHLDHMGIEDGEIFNGADDDGSGTVAIVEIAEAFKTAVKNGHGPKRSILFLHVTGEEKGLLGSRYYTDMDPIFPLANTVANLNIDMIGRTDPERTTGADNYIYLIGSDKLSTELHNISEEMNETYMNIELDYTYNDENDPNRFYYRSDHYNFAKNNIPVIFYFNGTHDDYHRASDTPDKIRYDLLENRTRLVFYTAWELANRDNRITVDKAAK